jgi:hypothetical protein
MLAISLVLLALGLNLLLRVGYSARQ